MTYGEKLIQLRKKANLTQQELGLQLGVTPQAVSKWEHDVAEPDLATLRKISEIFKISIDDFLDNTKELPISSDAKSVAEEITPIVVEEATKDVKENVVGEITPVVTDNVVKEITPLLADSVSTGIKESTESIKSAVEVAHSKTLGFCVECGKVVTEENKGMLTPKVLCSGCLKEKIAKEKRILIKEEKKKASQRLLYKHKRNVTVFWGLVIVAAVLTIAAVIIANSYKTVGEKVGMAFFAAWAAYALFAVLFECVMDTGAVVEIMTWGLTRSISWPGVIFTLDIDGILFFIFVKLLFGIISFLVGLGIFFIALSISMVISTFLFPFRLRKVNKKVKGETEIDIVDTL